MLDPNVAQSPVLAIAAANAASPADAGSAVSPGSGNPDGDPFAAVLQRQLAKPDDDAKTAPALDALIEIQVKIDGPAGDKSDAAAADAQAAVLAWLAPLFAGAVPVPPAAVGTTAEHPDGEILAVSTDPAAVMPIAIAAPIQPAASQGEGIAATTPGLSAQTTLSTPAAEAAGLPTPAAETAGLRTSAAQAAGSPTSAAVPTTDLPSQSSAILAGAKSMAAESSAQTGNGGNAPQAGAVQSFDSLLNAASAAAAHARPQTTAAALPATATPITTPVGAQGWENEIGGKLTWMVGRQETRAELVLNPPHMGRIEVSLSMNGNQANALFVSANPAVREALENAVPQLREILQDAGISLGQAHVGAESFRQSAHERENGDNPLRGKDRDAGTMTNTLAGGTAGLAPRRGNSLIDTFA